ncbi:hypothetical protein [Polaribacter sp. SA4-12]|uniref:hypothetical protein n=1 Tax=Polaribacter sp. SA4-12 TaxID=1312072 RepID=UPI0012FB2D9F|nr:hypothetical protein [Polaribacter sp. SA4-12]
MIFIQIFPPPAPPPPPPGLPIDTCLVFLMIIGVFYGVLKNRKKPMSFQRNIISK